MPSRRGWYRRNQRQDQYDPAAWSQPPRQQALGQCAFGKWQTQAFIAGLRCHELVAPWIIEGAIDGAAFDAYVETQLAPVLRQRGAWFLFLPKYSPDLNPIEMAFAKLKTLLRKAKARTYHDLIRAIGNICDRFELDECWNDLKEAGYVAYQAPDALVSVVMSVWSKMCNFVHEHLLEMWDKVWVNFH